jgi:hypothetical protein
VLLRQRFRQWRQGRPFWGALLTILAGIELFVAGRADIAVGGVVLQLGFSGLQTTIIPVVIVLAGVLVMAQPVHHLFYGVIALVLSVYAVVAVNLGGILAGTVLGVVGSIVVVSWMGARPVEPVPPAVPAAPAPEKGGLSLLFDDGPRREPYEHRWSAVALAVTLAAGGLTGTAPGEAPCLLGFILCDAGPTTSPSASPSPESSPPAEAAPSPAPSPSDVPTPVPSDTPTPSDPPVPSDPPTPSGAPTPEPSEVPTSGPSDSPTSGTSPEDAASPPDAATSSGDKADDAGATAPPEAGVSAEAPHDPPPAEDGVPVVPGGNEDVDVYAVPAELKAADLEISGIRGVTLVSVPVGNGTDERRNALKIVADHVLVSGFQLRTYAGAADLAAGTETTAESVAMDGAATMYITSLTASGPDGRLLEIDADAPPPTLTSLVLAALNPTVGLLGATSEKQVWSGFQERVWSR